MIDRDRFPGWEPFLRENQLSELVDHLRTCVEFGDDYVEFVATAIDADCAEYMSKIESHGATFPDFASKIAGVDAVIEGLRDQDNEVTPRPDEGKLLAYRAGLEKEKAFYDQFVTPKGRREKVERDDLIQQMFRYYPSGKATKTEGGHFEQTVSIS